MTGLSNAARLAGWGAIFLLGVISVARGDRAAKVETVEVEYGATSYQVSGPFTHENLSVYLIHPSSAVERANRANRANRGQRGNRANRANQRRFVTLEEGLKSGRVRITEKSNARVNTVLVENRMRYPVYIQEGDRIVGGRQDRMFVSPLVIAPNSGPVAVPCMCVEESRWSGGTQFRSPGLAAIAPKRVRLAAKLAIDQGEVWKQVAAEKQRMAKSLNAPDSQSSLNQTLESRQVFNAVKRYTNAMDDADRLIKDATGVAVAVNGQIEEINLYPDPQLTKQMYEKLLGSYAVQASMQKIHRVRTPSVQHVVAMINQRGRRARIDAINAQNQVEISTARGHFINRTWFNGAPVHTQWIRAEIDIKLNDNARESIDGVAPPALPDADLPQEYYDSPGITGELDGEPIR